MDDNPLYLSVNRLVSSVNDIPTITSEGLYDREFPDKLIIELHNHLGNVNQLVHASTDAFNATEQFMILKDAQKELDEVGSRLFEARQNGLLNESLYDNLSDQVRRSIDQISDSLDPEYT